MRGPTVSQKTGWDTFNIATSDPHDKRIPGRRLKGFWDIFNAALA
jgi:hypothetical protein